MKKYAIIFIVFFAILCKGVMFSQFVAEDAQAKLMLKIILYDRNFSRFGDVVKIGVSSKTMLKVLNRYKDKTIRGKTLEIGLMQSADDVEKYGVIYIDRNWKNRYDACKAKAKEKKVLMFCGSYKAVEKDQAGIAFRIIQNKIKIVLNLKVVKDMGTDFPSDLLKLSLVVGNL
jgi:uncharacterized protein DUF4154